MKIFLFRVVIIGSGNLAKAIIQRLLSKGFKSDQIFIIVRPGSNVSWFDGFNFSTSETFSDVDGFDPTHIILAVDATATGYALNGLQNANLNQLGGYRIISFIPGLKSEQISNAISGVHHRPIIARANTNMAFGENYGLISVDQNTSLIEYLAVPFIEKIDKVESSIFSISFMNGLNCTAIPMFAEDLQMSIPQYLGMISMLSGSQQLRKQLIRGSELNFTKKFMETVVTVFTKNFDYSLEDSRDRVLLTFIDSVKTLKSMSEKGIGGDNPVAVLKNTSIGAKRFEKISNPTHLCSYDFMWNEIFLPFKQEIDNSYKIVSSSIRSMYQAKAS